MCEVSQAPDLGIVEFEALAFDPEGFDHEAHLYVAWLYLRDHPVTEAIARYTDTLKRLTQKLGQPEKFHATITWFYLLEVADRLAGSEACDWQAFRRANPDLLARKGNVLHRYYRAEELASDRARQRFVLPSAVTALPADDIASR